MEAYAPDHKSGKEQEGQVLPALDSSPTSGSPAGPHTGPGEALMNEGVGISWGAQCLPVDSEITGPGP